MAERIEVIIDGQSAGYISATRQAEAATRSLGRTTATQSRAVSAYNAVATKQVQNLQAVGRMARYAAVGVGGILAYQLYQGVKAGAEFEAQMARVEAVSGATGEEMDVLRKKAMELGRDTKFSAGEAADAMYQLSSAGFSVRETTKAVDGVLSLAAASNIELADAAEISANALRAFGLDADQSTHVADVLAQAVNSSSVEMSDLQLTMKYIGPIAKATGQSLEEMVAAVSLMGDAGIKGEQAGTSLRAGLLRLVKPIGQTKEGLVALTLSAEDLQGPNGLLPLPELIGLIRERTEDMSKAQRNAALTQIFGQEALSGMLTVVDAGPRKLERLSREFEKSDGAAGKAAKTMNETVAGAWENFTGSIETVEIALFERFQKPMREALLEGADLVNSEGKAILDWLDAIVESPEFKAADLKGQLQILGEALGEEALEAFNDVLPKMAEAAAKGAPKIAQAFFEGFSESNVAGRLVLGGLLVSKMGLGPVLFRRRGVEAGTAYAEGMSTALARRTAAVAAAQKSVLQTPYGPMQSPVPLLGLEASLKERMASVKATALHVGKNVMGVSLGLGLLDGLTSIASGENVGASLQNSFSTATMGLIPRAEDMGEKVWAAYGSGAAEATQKAIDSLDPRNLKLAGTYIDGLITSFEAMGREVPPELREMDQSLARSKEQAKAWSREIRGDIKTLKITFADSLGEISDRTEENMRKVERSFGSHSRQGKELLADNYAAAVRAIEKAMADGLIATDKGGEAIEDLIRKRLALFGVKGPDAEKIINATDSKGNPTPGGKQRGGEVTGPGKSGDRHHIVVEDKEYVLNREAVKRIGVPTLDRWNYGMAPRFAYQEGGLVGMQQGGVAQPPGDPGTEVVQAAYANAVGQFLRRFRMDLTQGYNPGGPSVSPGHLSLDAPPSLDVVPLDGNWDGLFAQGLRWALSQGMQVGYDGQYGTQAWSNHGEGNHAHIDWAGGSSGGGGAKGMAALNALKLDLPTFSSDIPAFVPAAEQLNLVARAMEREIASRAGAVTGGGGAVPDVATGPIQAMAREMVLRMWGPGEWGPFVDLEMSEAGWDPRAVNPSSGAAGLAQALPPSKYPPGAWPYEGLESAKLQLQWMMGYIRERYGSPSAAWAFHQAHNWYQRGGVVMAGDSLTQGMQQYAGFPGGWDVRAKKGAPSSWGVGQLRSMLEPGAYEALVFAMGANDGSAAALRASLDQVAALHGRRGVALMNLAGSGIDALNAKNAAIRDHVREGAELADWAGLVANQPGLLAGDGVHATPEGYRAMQRLVKDAGNRAKNRARAAGESGDPLAPADPVHFGGGTYYPADVFADTFGINANTSNLSGKIAAAKKRIGDIDQALERDGKGKPTAEERKLMEAQRKTLEERLAQLRAALRKKRAERAAKLAKRGLGKKLQGEIGDLQERDLDLVEKIDIAETLASAEYGDGGSDYTQGEVDKLGALYNERLGVLGTERGALSTLIKRLGDQVAADQKKIDHKDTPKWKRRALRQNRDAAEAMRAEMETVLVDVQGRTGDGGYIFDVTDALRNLGVTPQEPDDGGLADLYKDQALAEALRANLADRQFKTMTDFFRGMSGLPYLGAFMTGTAGRRVGQTGLAVLHRDEQVVPDPEGPAGSTIAGGSAAGSVAPKIELVLADRSGELVELIDARIDGNQVNVTQKVSRALGRDSRRRAVAPGGRR